MEGYYSDLLHNTSNVIVKGSQKFDNCIKSSHSNFTQVRLVMDGNATFVNDLVALSEGQIRNLVSNQNLKKYFQAICTDMAAFDDTISQWNATMTTPNDSIQTQWVSALCHASPHNVAVTAGIAGAAIAGIVIGVIFFLMICVGIFTCCGCCGLCW